MRRPGIAPPGVSLAELLAVIVILGVAGGAIARVLAHHQSRFQTLVNESLAQTRLREGATLLATALSDIAPSAGDIYPGEFTHTSIAFRSPTGTFVLCSRSIVDLNTIDVAAATGFAQANDSATTDTWIDSPPMADPLAPAGPPAAGDSLFLYVSGHSVSTADDRWSRHLVTASAAGSCTATHRAFRLTLAPPPPASLDRHPPVITFRRTRFALYQSADNSWALGAIECNAVRSPACPSMQPVAGPFAAARPASDTLNGGLHLAYLDSAGIATTDPLRIARVRIRLRTPNAGTGAPTSASITTAIAFRNRP